MNNPFTGKFLTLRPYLYHLTFPENFKEIEITGRLERANTLFERAGKSELSRTRRRVHSEIYIEGKLFYVRDQAPLHRGPIEYAAGWAYEDLLHYLNDHVFFWPGDAIGPVPSGQRHFERYASEKYYVIRVPTSDLFSENSGQQPLFSKYNSGAPRCSYGRKVPRGPDTFVPANRFQRNPSAVVEVTFRATITLPMTAEAAASGSKGWKRLRSN